MKRLLGIFLIVFCLFQSQTFGQITASKNIITDAVFPGGPNEMTKFIQENITIPEDFKGTGIVSVRFEISPEGDVINPFVRRGIPECPQCNEEAIAVLNKMPKWKPAFSTVENKPVSSIFVLPIKFEEKKEIEIRN
ncbi:MAG TPA: energy transducer TonB [Taishania sp.]|nr:energy transducer TonB [Taishania sp.]